MRQQMLHLVRELRDNADCLESNITEMTANVPTDLEFLSAVEHLYAILPEGGIRLKVYWSNHGERRMHVVFECWDGGKFHENPILAGLIADVHGHHTKTDPKTTLVQSLPSARPVETARTDD